MKIIEQFPFEFYGSTFELYFTDQKLLLLPLRNICESLGISFSSQHRRIRDEEDEGLKEVLYPLRAPVMQKDGVVQEREIICINLKKLPYWLGTIDTKRINPDIKDLVVRYKNEFADAAWAFFRSKMLPDYVLAELDTALSPSEQEYHRLMDQAAALKDAVDSQGIRVGKVEDRVSASGSPTLGNGLHQPYPGQAVSRCGRHPREIALRSQTLQGLPVCGHPQ